MPVCLKTIADLRAYPAPTVDGYSVIVLGYYAANDGGGDLFVWEQSSTSADDAGATIIPNTVGASGRWRRWWPPGYASIRGYGASPALSDNSISVNKAMAYLNASNGGGTLRCERGRYVMGSMLAPPVSGSSIVFNGDGGLDQSGNAGCTVFIGAHSDDAVLNLQGIVGGGVNHLVLQGGDTSGPYPRTGLLEGRSSSGSAGWHVHNKLGIIGKFSWAGLYNAASEMNRYNDLVVSIDAASTAMNALIVTGAGRADTSTPLVGSSMIGAEFVNCQFQHNGTASTVSPIFIDGGIALANIAFRGGYVVQNNGSYVTIRTGGVDSYHTLGPITFDGMGGESPSRTPLYGFRLFSAPGDPSAIHGLSIRNCNLGMPIGYYIYQDSQTKLFNAVIMSQGLNSSNPSAVVPAPSQIGACKFGDAVPGAGENLNCQIDVGFGLRLV